MPYRIPNFATSLLSLSEGMFLSFTAVIASVNNLLDEQSWDRLTGRHGALFFMAIALIIFWNSNRVTAKRNAENLMRAEEKEDARRKIEDAARELRHREAMALQEKNADKLLELSHEAIKAQFHVAQSLTDLKEALDGRPCGMNSKKVTS